MFACSFPALSCEFATLDVSDALGTVSSSKQQQQPAAADVGLLGSSTAAGALTTVSLQSICEAAAYCQKLLANCCSSRGNQSCHHAVQPAVETADNPAVQPRQPSCCAGVNSKLHFMPGHGGCRALHIWLCGYISYFLWLQKRMNLTKTVRKAPIDLNMDRQGAAYEDTHKHDPKYDDEDMWVSGVVRLSVVLLLTQQWIKYGVVPNNCMASHGMQCFVDGTPCTAQHANSMLLVQLQV